MRARLARARGVRAGQRIERLRDEQVVEGDDAVGRRIAVAADVTDREDLGRDLHGEVVVVHLADSAADDQGVRADPAERRHRLGAPPQERQRHRDQSGPDDAEDRERALHRVGGLNGDHGVGAQPHTAQPAGDGRHHAIGLRIGEAARLAGGEASTIRWIDERDRVRTPGRRPSQQLVERGANAEGGRRGTSVGVVEDHGMGLVGS